MYPASCFTGSMFYTHTQTRYLWQAVAEEGIFMTSYVITEKLISDMASIELRCVF